MNTNTQTKTQAIYEPLHNRITFVSNGVIQHGFVGNTATRKFMEAMSDETIEVIIKDSTKMEQNKLLKQFHGILARKGLLEIKSDIVGQYGVTSSKDLTSAQLNEIILKLSNEEVRPEMRQERSVVLVLLDKLGVKGNKEIGWDHVNNYLKQTRLGGKPLYEMNLEELKEVQKKLRMIVYKKPV